MKKVICNQVRMLSEDELQHVIGGGNTSDSIQTAISGDRGCGAGASDENKNKDNNPYSGNNNYKGGCGSSGSSGSSGSRVICTHFYKKGMMDRALWKADLKYTQEYLSSITVRGYHFWAIPYVELMRKNSLFEKIMFPIAKYRAIELAYQMKVIDKGSLRGKLIRLIVEPSCYIIGLFCEQKNWEYLWVKQ